MSTWSAAATGGDGYRRRRDGRAGQWEKGVGWGGVAAGPWRGGDGGGQEEGGVRGAGGKRSPGEVKVEGMGAQGAGEGVGDCGGSGG